MSSKQAPLKLDNIDEAGHGKTSSSSKRMADTASAALEDALGVLEIFSDLTKDVPYIGIATGIISKLLKLREVRCWLSCTTAVER